MRLFSPLLGVLAIAATALGSSLLNGNWAWDSSNATSSTLVMWSTVNVYIDVSDDPDGMATVNVLYEPYDIWTNISGPVVRFGPSPLPPRYS